MLNDFLKSGKLYFIYKRVNKVNIPRRDFFILRGKVFYEFSKISYDGNICTFNKIITEEVYDA